MLQFLTSLRHPTIGVSVSDTHLSGALVQGGVLVSYQSIDLKEHIVEGHIVRDHAGFVTAVRSLKAALINTPSLQKKKFDVTFVLPSNLLFSTWVPLVDGDKRPNETATEQLSKLVPEETNMMSLLFTPVQTSDKHTVQSVLAARKDILHEYTEAFQEGGMTLSLITSSASVLCSCAKTKPKTGSMTLLVNELFSPPTITLMKDYWPLDEQLLDEKTEATQIQKDVKQWTEEYLGYKLPIDRIVAAASDDLVAELTKDSTTPVETYACSVGNIPSNQLAEFCVGLATAHDVPNFIHGKSLKIPRLHFSLGFLKRISGRNLLYIGILLVLVVIRGLMYWLL